MWRGGEKLRKGRKWGGITVGVGQEVGAGPKGVGGGAREGRKWGGVMMGHGAGSDAVLECGRGRKRVLSGSQAGNGRLVVGGAGSGVGA